MDKTNENDIEFRDGKTTGVKYMFRGPKIDWGILVLGKGETLSKHYHKEVEETFYFISGSCKMLIDDREFITKPGDAFRVEPNKSHYMKNEHDKPVKMIFIKCPYIPNDKVKVK
ncbi:MAG: cupin domain-containing protein [Candidatus Lokiarchaeota archaeon]|nr:cupin domain-containing protein [Candidatus Lokiarchaeota archaeon]